MLNITHGDHNKYIITDLNDKTSYAHLTFTEKMRARSKYIKVEINGLDYFDGEFSKTFCVRTSDQKVRPIVKEKRIVDGNIYEDGMNPHLENIQLERQGRECMSQISLKHIKEDIGGPVYDAIITELNKGVPTKKGHESVVFKNIGSLIVDKYNGLE